MDISDPFAIIYKTVCLSFLKQKHTMYSFQTYDFNKQPKFVVLKRFGNNVMNTDSNVEVFIMLFQKSQIVFNVFRRFYSNHVKKKTVHYDCILDINLEPLNLLQETQKFTFIQYNKQFTFNVKDLLKIIKNNLLQHNHFFSEPIFPRNPYTNSEFQDNILYNFYFHLIKHNYTIPAIFSRFFEASLNLDDFTRINGQFIRESIIDDYPLQLTNNELYEEIIMTLRIVKPNNMYIDVMFPRNIVINSLVKYYRYYLHSRMDLTKQSRDYYRDKFTNDLYKFISKNHGFGYVYDSNPSDLVRVYKICNMLSNSIPDYDNIEDILEFMELDEIHT